MSQTFITGQSSGGYGALWLALHFSDRFGGCWAISPDPIDFSNFTGVNIYEAIVRMRRQKRPAKSIT